MEGLAALYARTSEPVPPERIMVVNWYHTRPGEVRSVVFFEPGDVAWLEVGANLECQALISQQCGLGNNLPLSRFHDPGVCVESRVSWRGSGRTPQ